MKVFLADDEIAIRESLRNSFPWEEKGFQLVGEAPDGEMALPMIRDLNPDILLTDIRMPFMDGIELCREVKRTMPWVSIIILSGFDDFSYAQQAISLGVREYLLKPVTAQEIGRVLDKTREQIMADKRERENMAALRERIFSGNQFVRDKLLASLFSEDMDRYEQDALLEQMRALGVNLAASQYTVLDISFDEDGEARMAARAAISALSESSGGTVHVCSAQKGARALILGDNEKDVEERAYSFAASILQLQEVEHLSHLLVTIGKAVDDYHQIQVSMAAARHLRHMVAARGAWDRKIVGANEDTTPLQRLSELELSPLYERLQYAPVSQLESILMDYTSALEPGLAEGYLRVAAPLAARHLIEHAGGDVRKVLGNDVLEKVLHQNVLEPVTELLRRAMQYRDAREGNLDESPVSRARAYISSHYADPNLMLQDVAGEVHLSPSHFSTIFAQEAGITFTQYLTGVRIGKAKELLAGTDLRSFRIASEVGYNDPHYFSYLFKKTTGVTPSEWRRMHGENAEGEKNPTPAE